MEEEQEEEISQLLHPYVKDSQSKWFDFYNGISDVIFDDFNGGFPITELLQMLDRTPKQVENKGGFVNFAPKSIVITSNHWYTQWYSKAKQNMSIDRIVMVDKAIERRIDNILIFMGKDKILLYKGKIPRCYGFVPEKNKSVLEDFGFTSYPEEEQQPMHDDEEEGTSLFSSSSSSSFRYDPYLTSQHYLQDIQQCKYQDHQQSTSYQQPQESFHEQEEQEEFSSIRTAETYEKNAPRKKGASIYHFVIEAKERAMQEKEMQRIQSKKRK
jgi:hypothetical protein